MKVLLQRVSRSEVRIGGQVVGSTGVGLVAFVGIERGDREAVVDYLADKTLELRIFPDDHGKMNRNVMEAGGGVLVVSQFTLAASTRRGRRPSFDRAAAPGTAEPLYRRFLDRIASRGVNAASGVFQAMMEVELVNDGPVTILLDDPPGAPA